MSSVHGQLMGWMVRAMGGPGSKNLGPCHLYLVPLHPMQADIVVSGTRLEKVDNFCFLGSFISNDCLSLEKEIQFRLGALLLSSVDSVTDMA